MKYRKKPVVVEAQLMDGTEDSARAALTWADPFTLGTVLAVPEKGTDRWTVVIETLEGAMAARPGDWIIRGTEGEFYPYKPAAFDATFEPVDA